MMRVILSEAKDLMAWQAAMRSLATLGMTGCFGARPNERFGPGTHL